MSKGPLVVVGTDGSPTSDRAVEWAADYVRATHGKLRIVVAWAWPQVSGTAVVTEPVDLSSTAREIAEKAIAGVGLADEQTEISVAEGAAGVALVAESRSADLLVVGSHGESLLSRALLGSVSTYCLHHTTIPVVVVR